MPIINYVREHIRFMEYAADEHLSANERLLWYALMHIMNQRAQGKVWPGEFVRISNDRLLSYVPMKFDTLASARNGLKQRGLIEVEKGEKNKKSPAYRMIYFYPQYIAPDTESDCPESNPEISDNMGGNMGYNMGGNRGDNIGGNMGDNNINYTSNIRNPSVTPNPVSEEDKAIVNPHGGHAHARGNPAEIIRAFPPRNRRLYQDEAVAVDWIKHYALEDFEETKAMYGEDGGRIIHAIADSDVFPVDLVAFAVQKTYERNRKFPLGNAAAYTLKLLYDWKDQGFETRKEVQESKDDWCHYA